MAVAEVLAVRVPVATLCWPRRLDLRSAQIQPKITQCWPRRLDLRSAQIQPKITQWSAPGNDDIVTQLLLGERLLVEEERDGWVRGIALGQPAGRLDPRGYPGWLPATALAARSSTVDGEPYLVDALTAGLYDVPAGEVVLTGVVIGTRLSPAGPPRRGWLAVRVPGHDRPLWIPEADVAVPPPPDPASALGQAERLLGVPYVWGGLTPDGIDCSGLVHLSWRRCGTTLPRDADDQYRATTPVPFGAERPGDLYFFARDGKPVHHVGFVAQTPSGSGERWMLHASYSVRRVVAEPLAGERAATLVAAHRVPI